MSKHTEGPWTVGEVRHAGKYQLVQRHDLTGYICEVQAPYFGNAIDTDTREANARLIAAAPSLLEAVERAHEVLWHYDLADQPNGVRWSHPDDLREELIKTLWAVICAARGQEA